MDYSQSEGRNHVMGKHLLYNMIRNGVRLENEFGQEIRVMKGDYNNEFLHLECGVNRWTSKPYYSTASFKKCESKPVKLCQFNIQYGFVGYTPCSTCEYIYQEDESEDKYYRPDISFGYEDNYICWIEVVHTHEMTENKINFALDNGIKLYSVDYEDIVEATETVVLREGLSPYLDVLDESGIKNVLDALYNRIQKNNVITENLILKTLRRHLLSIELAVDYKTAFIKEYNLKYGTFKKLKYYYGAKELQYKNYPQMYGNSKVVMTNELFEEIDKLRIIYNFTPNESSYLINDIKIANYEKELKLREKLSNNLEIYKLSSIKDKFEYALSKHDGSYINVNSIVSTLSHHKCYLKLKDIVEYIDFDKYYVVKAKTGKDSDILNKEYDIKFNKTDKYLFLKKEFDYLSISNPNVLKHIVKTEFKIGKDGVCR